MYRFVKGTGRLIFILFFLSFSSEGLSLWFKPFILSDKDGWYLSPYWLGFYWIFIHHPCEWRYIWSYLVSHRTQRACWGSWHLSRIPVRVAVFSTHAVGIAQWTQLFRIQVKPGPFERAGSSRDIQKSHWYSRWICVSWVLLDKKLLLEVHLLEL